MVKDMRVPLDESKIISFFAVWYDQTNAPYIRQYAAREIVVALLPYMNPPRRAAAFLGPQRVEEMKQEIWAKLFDPVKRVMVCVDPKALTAYVRRAVANEAVDAIRYRDRRPEDAVAGDVLDGLPTREAADSGAELAERAAELQGFAARLASLKVDDRLAILLTIAPDRIADEDWREVARRHAVPPAPPDRPLDYDEASRLIWPEEEEDSAARRRRMDRIRNRIRVASKQLRDARTGRDEA